MITLTRYTNTPGLKYIANTAEEFEKVIVAVSKGIRTTSLAYVPTEHTKLGQFETEINVRVGDLEDYKTIVNIAKILLELQVQQVTIIEETKDVEEIITDDGVHYCASCAARLAKSGRGK